MKLYYQQNDFNGYKSCKKTKKKSMRGKCIKQNEKVIKLIFVNLINCNHTDGETIKKEKKKL